MAKIGLIAGNGRFPFLVADQIKKNGEQAVIIALNEETDRKIDEAGHKVFWVPLGQLQKMIEIFRGEGVSIAIMAGQVKHAQLFAKLKLDWRAVKLLGRIVNKKTDTILGAVCDEFQKEGIKLLPSHQYLLHLLPKKGLICGEKPGKYEKDDIEFGLRIANQIAGMDIGQTVVVKDKAVVAVESIEGTDECIKRAAKYAGDGVVVVKVAKPNQDFRFDIPVIGPRTVETLAANKVRLMAVEAESTLMIDREELVRKANEMKVTIIAVENKNEVKK